LYPPWRPGIERAVDALKLEYSRRRDIAARLIADLLVTALTARGFEHIDDDADPRPVIAKLETQLKAQLREREQDCRRQIETVYRHEDIKNNASALPVIEADLFSAESAELFGLSRGQLVASGVMSGALAGGGIDVLLGGASLLAGAGIGAAVGGVSALLGSERLGKLKVLGRSLMSRKITVGPFRDRNLPWVLLGRALLHHELVAERNHARREAVVVEAQASSHRADELPDDTRRALNAEFAAIKRRGYDPLHSGFADLIKQLLREQALDE
jgi:hypothetical protein